MPLDQDLTVVWLVMGAVFTVMSAVAAVVWTANEWRERAAGGQAVASELPQLPAAVSTPDPPASGDSTCPADGPSGGLAVRPPARGHNGD